MICSEILNRLSIITAEEQAILDGRASIDRSIYTEHSLDVIEGAKLLSKGKLIAVRPHTRFIHFPEHTHDYVEIVYMCSGQTRHYINGTDVTLREGELLLLSQNATHEICLANKQDVAVNFIIRPEFFNGTLPYLDNDETPLRKFLIDCLRGGSDAKYLYFQVADILPIQNLIENLLWSLISDIPHKRSLNQMTFALLFLLLTSHTDRLQYQSPGQEATLRILRYVEENYSHGSLTEAAKLVHYDIGWLSREIKKHTGKTYTELVQEKRLQQAAWMLMNTDECVATIARTVGYENISYFHRIFAARFQMSPRQYRKTTQ